MKSILDILIHQARYHRRRGIHALYFDQTCPYRKSNPDVLMVQTFEVRVDAILVDIDHSPDSLLDPQNADFYQPSGLKRLAAHLHAGGVFGLWSNELPDESFTARLSAQRDHDHHTFECGGCKVAYMTEDHTQVSGKRPPHPVAIA